MDIQFSQTPPSGSNVLRVIPLSETHGVMGGAVGRLAASLAQAAASDAAFLNGDRKIMTVNTGRDKALLVNIGPAGKFEPRQARELAGPLHAVLKDEKARHAVLELDGIAAPAAAHLADALRAAAYSYRTYKSEPEKNPGPSALTVVTLDKGVEKAFEKLALQTDSVFWASDLVNAPPNVLTPQAYAEIVESKIRGTGASAQTIGNGAMRDMGMNALLAVGRGSAQPSRLVVLKYDGSGGKQKTPLVLVGKGITFDSGGISIKPSDGMAEMKMDMGGSAAVAGAFLAAVQRGTAANIAAVLPMAENMPGGGAITPGSIVTSYSGKTIEIVDTDAEGRLVLADAMTYAQRDLNADKVVTAATLTGAVGVAIGAKMAGLFTEDKKLLEIFQSAAQKTGERLWHLPMGKDFEEIMTKGTPADIKNYGGKIGGASTAAAFLNFFIDKDEKQRAKAAFAHIDLAYTAMPEQDLKGWGVRLLDDAIRRHEPGAKR